VINHLIWWLINGTHKNKPGVLKISCIATLSKYIFNFRGPKKAKNYDESQVKGESWKTLVTLKKYSNDR
jgi:hypothetical protein